MDMVVGNREKKEIDKTTMLTTMLTYACFNLLTNYYKNDD